LLKQLDLCEHMNRKERRAAHARAERAKLAERAGVAQIAELAAAARYAYERGRFGEAEILSKQILAQQPAHRESLNLLGLIEQSSGHHKRAIRSFAKALALNEVDAVCHYNVAFSYQAMEQRVAASSHFKKALLLGLGGKNAEDLVLQNSRVLRCLDRIAGKLGPSSTTFSGIGKDDISAIAEDLFIQSSLKYTLIRGVTLERFFTELRSALVAHAKHVAFDEGKSESCVVELFCALAQQCFLNEYVYALSGQEAAQAQDFRDLLSKQMASGDRISVLLLAAVAAFFPLHSIPDANLLLDREWPSCAMELLRTQVREPFEEVADLAAIQQWTAIEDKTSRIVQEQYEENPYPRWLSIPPSDPVKELSAGNAGKEILIAGCGTGRHALQIAQQFPGSRILALDISRASLAYARRKAREAGVINVDFRLADILKLGDCERKFDRIEAVGVLHHLADPEQGLRVLLSLLAPAGILRIGLYSTAARRSIADVRAIISANGYSPTHEDIRALRRTIISNMHDDRWKVLLWSAEEFYNTSGCRDLFFNAVEHGFTIPAIARLLNKHGLLFHGFEVNAEDLAKSKREFPHANVRDLDFWAEYEAVNPNTFRHMYIFSVSVLKSQ
jgi:SAM-dependent methyltransferase/tetratricopeptide (TPR) repeat protein